MTLVVTYEVPSDAKDPDLEGYYFDPRVFDPERNEVATCLVFMPRLELIYAENDKLFCTFLGGSQMNGKMTIDGATVRIGPNRVILRVDSSSYALERFLLEKRVSQNYSILIRYSK